MADCKGRRALVTGASRGIGKAIALRLAAEGADVVLCASRLGTHGDLAGTLEGTLAEIEAAGGRAATVIANLASEEERGDLVARAEEAFGPLDILVNNAAMGVWALPSESKLADRRRMLEVNLHAPVDLAQQALPGMRARGLGNRYSEGLAHEVCADGVFVNVLAPVSIVLTQEAARFVGHIARRNPDMAEPIEVMVEAALELLTERHVGQIAYSRPLLHSVGRPVRSLDGSRVIGDAFLPADLEAVVA
jgi:NAD(P)-dependent dehydrogenase (short-subunit alcohol dehydrogenase family)